MADRRAPLPQFQERAKVRSDSLSWRIELPERTAETTDIFEIMHTMRAMRRLKPDPVPDELIRKILLAGQAAANGGNTQVDLNGYDNGESRDPHVVGYDRDVYFSAGYCHPAHDPKDDRRFRSHLSVIVTPLDTRLVSVWSALRASSMSSALDAFMCCRSR